MEMGNFIVDFLHLMWSIIPNQMEVWRCLYDITHLVSMARVRKLINGWWMVCFEPGNHYYCYCTIRWVKIPESFPTSIRGFSGSNDEDILWNFPNWFIRNLRNGVLFYRQLQADCLYHINCLYNFPAYTWRQKRNAFPGLCNGSIFMIQKNLIIISGTEPRFLCWEIKLTVSYIDNSS